jgi:hypothetical protein
MKMSKYFYAGLLCIVLVSMLVISCVKIPTEAPPLPEFLAKIRVVNVAESLGAVNVSVRSLPDTLGLKAVAMGNVNVGEDGAYKTIDAGTKVFTNGANIDTLVVTTDLIGSIFVIDEAQDLDDNVAISAEWSLDDFTNPAMADTVAQVIVAQMSSDTLGMVLEGIELADEDAEREDWVWEAAEATWTHPGTRNLRFMVVDVAAGLDTLTVTKGETTVEIPLDITGGTSTTVVLTGTIADLKNFTLNNALE